MALENIELVPSEFFVSRYYETLEHQLSTIYRQFMLVYENCRHEESTPQVREMERAFKKSSESQCLNKLIRDKNVDGFLPRLEFIFSRCYFPCVPGSPQRTTTPTYAVRLDPSCALSHRVSTFFHIWVFSKPNIPISSLDFDRREGKQ